MNTSNNDEQSSLESQVDAHSVLFKKMLSALHPELKKTKIKCNRPPKRGESKNARKARKQNKKAYDSMIALSKRIAKPLLRKAFTNLNSDDVVKITPLS